MQGPHQKKFHLRKWQCSEEVKHLTLSMNFDGYLKYVSRLTFGKHLCIWHCLFISGSCNDHIKKVLNACIKGHLEPTHLKSSPLFTFSTKWLGQDSPSVHLFSKTIGSRSIAAKIKLGEDSPSWFIYSRSRFTFK